MTTPSLLWLLARGDEVAVEQGRLAISPASKRQPPAEWLALHERNLIAQTARLAKVSAFEYLSYSVGQYGPSRAGGVTLQFQCITTAQPLFAIFNADTKRARSTRHGKAGSPLPAGQFRVGRRSAFYQFWASTGLPIRRLSDFNDYMGKLGGFVFTGELSQGERLNASTLRPLAVTSGELATLARSASAPPDNNPTNHRQAPDNSPTSLPDKESPNSQQSRYIQPISTTGEINYGKTVIRQRGRAGRTIIPEEQSIDEWLDDYERTIN